MNIGDAYRWVVQKVKSISNSMDNRDPNSGGPGSDEPGSGGPGSSGSNKKSNPVSIFIPELEADPTIKNLWDKCSVVLGEAVFGFAALRLALLLADLTPAGVLVTASIALIWLLSNQNSYSFEDPYNKAKDLKYNQNPVDPLILDLNGDGIKTTSKENGIYFDHDKNSFAELSSWVDDNDGVLVRDLNNDGVINNGGELFGDQTILSNGTKAINGFEALADLDSNKDGKIDKNDEAFSQLKILKGDGTLLTLQEADIASLNSDYTNTDITDDSGNTQCQAGSYTKTDGTTLSMGDYYLLGDSVNTVAAEWLDVPADIAALPDARGYGHVYSLQQAMVRDTSGTLKTLVQSYINTTDPAGILEVNTGKIAA